MTKKIVICSRFNYSDFNLSERFHLDPLSTEWITGRMKIFQKYTRQSFEHQTNQDFLAVLSCYEESMPLINELLAMYPPLPPNIIFTAHKQPLIENYVKESDEVYLVRIDSDDLYHTSFIDFLHNHQRNPETSVLVCKNGYVYSDEKELLSTYSNTSPSVYTQMFSTQDFIEVYQYFPELSHTIAHRFPYEPLLDRTFMLVVHSKNTWQDFTDRYTHTLIQDESQKALIKKGFGL